MPDVVPGDRVGSNANRAWPSNKLKNNLLNNEEGESSAEIDTCSDSNGYKKRLQSNYKQT